MSSTRSARREKSSPESGDNVSVLSGKEFSESSGDDVGADGMEVRGKKRTVISIAGEAAFPDHS
jgi:hypothetical protein